MTKENLMILARIYSLYGPQVRSTYKLKYYGFHALRSRLPDVHLNIKQVKLLSQLTHLRHLATPVRAVNYVTAVHALVATVYGRRRLRKSEEQFW